MRWEITIPDWVPDSRLSLNGRRRTHPQVVAKLTRMEKRTFTAYVHLGRTVKQIPVGPPTDPAHVGVTFIYPTHRRRDPDGLAGLVKPILDVLVDEGLLVDDDCEHITLSIAADVQKGTTATRIIVESPDA